ncbi:hypothetical protein [uncultured Endozoicomonas sp.]|uniref:hypothetical protein n=1 Tax=uncultured Endozoicomonas sp. TaxID=432652 RepID=UPI0026034CF3|nr:hypothetical protein [uncultured Endozoicomonas sp.]
MSSTDTTEYESVLREFEQSLEQSLEAKDWDRMMSVNQELQRYFQILSDDGVVGLPPVQRALTRVQVLFDALIQVCIRHRSGSLAMIKQTQNSGYALARYEDASSLNSESHQPSDYFQER